ncbi:helix-turn-helix domain-containing protein [Actinoalloteichus caeruleus]|uniref:helix-turn-helix domain-containing protein n=1 Tax=Actinoalloteichus cyanogriseus TaxID=2893586 RepID=UPI003AAB697A
MSEYRAGVRMRRVCRELRKWRESAGLKATEAAKQLKWSPSKISRIEHAVQAPTSVETLALALTYGVPERDRDRLFAAVTTAQEGGWWSQYSDVLWDAAQDLIELEDEASSVRIFKAQLVPGLFQTGDYFAALSASWLPKPTAEVSRQRSFIRETRQERLTSTNPLHVHAVLWEPLLRGAVGGPEVMRGQLRRLLELAELPHVRIQVLPTGAGAHPALGSEFVVLGFREEHLDDVVYFETLNRGDYAEESAAVQRHVDAFHIIQEAAMDCSETRKLISRLLQ